MKFIPVLWITVLLGGCTERDGDIAAATDANRPEATVARSPVTLVIDYSALPDVTVDARGAPLDEILRSLAQGAGFEYAKSERITADRRVDGVVEGPLIEVLDWLLFGESFVVAFDDGGAKVARLDWLGHGPTVGAGEARVAGQTVIELNAAGIARYQASGTPVNEDLRAWLAREEQRVASAGSASPARVRVSLYDAPASVADMLQRISYPTTPEFAEERRENRAPGTPPRHLSGANDAAQNDIAEALARTTALARRNVAALTEALDRACLQADCPGVAPVPAASAPPPVSKDSASAKGP